MNYWLWMVCKNQIEKKFESSFKKSNRIESEFCWIVAALLFTGLYGLCCCSSWYRLVYFVSFCFCLICLFFNSAMLPSVQIVTLKDNQNCSIIKCKFVFCCIACVWHEVYYKNISDAYLKQCDKHEHVYDINSFNTL